MNFKLNCFSYTTLGTTYMIFVMIFFETVQHDILAKEGASLPVGHTTTYIPFFSWLFCRKNGKTHCELGNFNYLPGSSFLIATIAVLGVDSKKRGLAGLQPPLLLTLHCHRASLHGLLAQWEMGLRANAGASQVWVLEPVEATFFFLPKASNVESWGC